MVAVLATCASASATWAMALMVVGVSFAVALMIWAVNR